MANKKILLLLGHPNAKSLCAGLLDAYRKGAEKSGAEIRIMKVGEMQFDPTLLGGFISDQPFEPDLAKFQADLTWADHLVIAFPLWWGGMPAILKGLIDRTFLPGYAFKYKVNSPFQDKLLKGKSVRILMTSDSPNFWYNLVLGKPLTKGMRRQIFGFTGFKPIKLTLFGNVRGSSPEKRKKWLESVSKLGEKQI